MNWGGREPLILGHFNLDENKKYNIDYSHKAYFELLINTFEPAGLEQLIDFDTWARLVNGQWRSSRIDHFYMSDVSRINAINQVESVIGDHKIVVITIQDVKAAPETRYGRDWRKYANVSPFSGDL